MAKKIVMPKLGLTMKKGKLMKWYKDEGDFVKLGDKIFSIETDKITNDAEATEEGYLRKILVKAGEIVPVMEPVGIVADKDEDISHLLSDISIDTQVEKPEIAQDKKQETTQKPERGKRVRISPVAKKLAEENEIDYEQITGTGLGGRIVLKDIEEAIENKYKIKISPTAKKIAQMQVLIFQQYPRMVG